MKAVKEIPYGIANFVEVAEQNMYYVDKTMYLPLLEKQPRNLFLIRPRRFGKSIFLSMLRAYYDVSQKDEFQKRFGNLWIGKQPTPLQGQFQIVYMDFSRIGGMDNDLAKNFNDYCCMVVDDFASVYESQYYPGFAKEMKAQSGSNNKLNYLNLQAHNCKVRLYLIIDEYDNFTNIVLNEQGEEIYHALTHASGFYREVFKKFKGMFERIFMTGVSPVTLDDLTSGFNIGWNISTDPQFNMMLGFSETDVREMFRYYQDAGQLQGNIEEMIKEMKPWYDNYCFAKDSLKCDPKMFNCDMVFYYLRNYMNAGKSPDQMIDPNTRTDYNKMKKLIQLDRLDGDRKGVLRRITEEGQIVTTLYSTFPAKEITKPEIFPSLLFYYGMLTITATRGDRLVLSIPNNNVRKQYYEFMLEDYQDKQYINLNNLIDLFDSMAFDGHWREPLEFIARAYKENSSVRSAIEGERNIQGFFTAYLSVNAYYLTAPEVELNHGFCDLFLMPDLQRYGEVAHSYILELKYLPAKDFDGKAKAQWLEAVEQIKGYAAGPRVQQLIQGTRLHCIVMQFSGCELARIEEVTTSAV
ncbi:MAG: AAA family ATPase [Bacteroides cellulosilyticus]|uniref:ATP-binding protein n=1 Tax=Bacteroides cellulosilyticus TaxID=246787 RepID=UPI001E12B919|nr:ATP-binding protein [Bacteroides intestinalis]MBD8984404.1 AAA family ATPase [Bacteroides cellulosilyticus]